MPKPDDLRVVQHKGFIIEPAQLFKYGVSFPHTSHCLADGSIMISTLGDAHGNHKGSLII
ncbi:hypothetical protein NECAME_03614 [Necator americanus]|uniref:Uncharacterized protein n=1 Tax=Necator americanus TaxID=51031 RepID=W2T3P6_NECAM|nr:hypothetical protein NECAME_03614 [Necator americanus]ETN75841.1 hypothetical protein NECAME_03614 [Necator americanus]